MLSGLIDSDRGESESSFNRSAEKELIRPLLNESYFADIKIRMLLSSYVHAQNDDKNEIIKQIMRCIWKGNELFDAFSEFDMFLGFSGKRGHYIHQFEVFVLGLNVILAIKNKKPELFSTFVFNDLDQVITTWLITSAAHDFGYPVESANKVITTIGKLYEHFSLISVKKACDEFNIREIIKSSPEYNNLFVANDIKGDDGQEIKVGRVIFDGLIDSIDSEPGDVFDLQSKLFNSGDHAYIGSVLLCKSMLSHLFDGSIEKTKLEPWKYSALKYAMSAIALHGLNAKNEEDAKFINMLSYNKNPYAFLLFIFDNLQDWNRTIKKDAQYAQYFLNDISISSSSIKIDYCIEHEIWGEKIVKSANDFIEEKRKNFENLKQPVPPLGIDFQINFHFNNGLPQKHIRFLL